MNVKEEKWFAFLIQNIVKCRVWIWRLFKAPKNFLSVIATFQKLAYGFENSTERLATFEDKLVADNDKRKIVATKQTGHFRTKPMVKSCDTLYTLHNTFQAVVNTLETLKHDRDEKTGMHLVAIQTRYRFSSQRISLDRHSQIIELCIKHEMWLFESDYREKRSNQSYAEEKYWSTCMDCSIWNFCEHCIIAWMN